MKTEFVFTYPVEVCGTMSGVVTVPTGFDPAKEQLPVIVFLHGAGERGTNNVSQLVWGCDEIVSWFKGRNEEFYLVAGQVPDDQQWVNTPWTLTEHTMPKEPSARTTGGKGFALTENRKSKPRNTVFSVSA